MSYQPDSPSHPSCDAQPMDPFIFYDHVLYPLFSPRFEGCFLHFSLPFTFPSSQRLFSYLDASSYSPVTTAGLDYSAMVSEMALTLLIRSLSVTCSPSTLLTPISHSKWIISFSTAPLMNPPLRILLYFIALRHKMPPCVSNQGSNIISMCHLSEHHSVQTHSIPALDHV